MGRIISQAKIEGILQTRIDRPDALGPALGEMLIKGNVPIEAVAGLLSVSGPTIYRWMYGNAEPVDPDKIAKIRRLLTILRKARRAKDLPMRGSSKERTIALRELIISHSPAVRT